MNKVDGLFGLSTRPEEESSSYASHVEELSSSWWFSHDGYHYFCTVYADSSLVGWLFGTPIDLENEEVVKTRLDLACDDVSELIWSEVCQRIAGSWVFIMKTEDGIDLRQDACGSIGLVYDKEAQAVASHAYLLLGDDYEKRLDEVARGRHEVANDGWITGGETAHRGIGRLLPNHRLKLPECEVSRLDFDFPEYDHAIEPIVRDMANEIRLVLSALAKSKDVYCSLTGGEDARAILAALRPIAGEFKFMTFAYPQSGQDVDLAKRVAWAGGINHTVFPSLQGGDPELWLIGAGHAMAGKNKEFYPTASQLAEKYMVGGLGGEVGKAFLWDKDTSPNLKVTAAGLIQKLKFPLSDELRDVIQKWLDGIPSNLDAYQILDLAYIELRMACWAFAQPWMKPTPTRIHPFISYNQFRRMRQIPPQIRATKGVPKIIIEQEWPELLAVPINKSGNPVRDLLNSVRNAIRQPDLVRRKVRQLLPSSPRKKMRAH